MSLIREADSDATLEAFIENEFDPKLKHCIGNMKKDECSVIEFRVSRGCNGENLLANLKGAVSAARRSNRYNGIGFSDRIDFLAEVVYSGNPEYPNTSIFLGHSLKIVRNE